MGGPASVGEHLADGVHQAGLRRVGPPADHARLRRLEDDDTRVIGNTFEAHDATHPRDHPVRDTVIERNQATIAGNDDPYRWIHGCDGLRMVGAIDACADEPPPRLAPGWDEVAEGDGTLRIPVELSAPVDRTVTATWVTATLDRDGWASLGEDVAVEKHGTIELDPGQTSTSVEIELIDDKRPEDDELIVARLTSVDGAVPGGFYSLGFGRILDDDSSVLFAPPRLTPRSAPRCNILATTPTGRKCDTNWAGRLALP